MSLSPADEIAALSEGLHCLPLLAARGFSFEVAAVDSVVVGRGRHVLGLWRHAEGRYAWIPAGFSAPAHHVGDCEAAIRYTLVVLATAC